MMMRVVEVVVMMIRVVMMMMLMTMMLMIMMMIGRVTPVTGPAVQQWSGVTVVWA